MKFKIYTTVDITVTNARRGDNVIAYKQQQNYLTVINTIGLRVNPTITAPSSVTTHRKFGKDKVWELDVEIEFEGALTLDMLENDFALVPFFNELSETATFKENVFVTKGSNANIIFDIYDK